MMMKRVIMNFSGAYDHLSEDPGGNKILSFRDLTGTDGYCSEEASEEIRRRLKSESFQGIHYLDNGNYHYLSKFWLEKIPVPFQLVMLDHHTDMQPSALLPLLSCGNWLLESLNHLPNLKTVWLIGPPEQSFAESVADEQNRLVRISEPDANCLPTDEMMNGFDPSLPIYISVDKDLLAAEVFTTNWDQGSMTLERLEDILRWFSSHGEILGMDLCGEETGYDQEEINLRLEQCLNASGFGIEQKYLQHS